MRCHRGDALAPRLTLIALVVCAPSLLWAQERPWTITPGIGHDQFEQSFFLEDTLELDPDSLRSLERTIEELKESYASLEAAYGRNATVLSNTFYLTDAAARNVSSARTRLRMRSFRLDANGRLDWKGEDNRDTLTSSYVVGQISLTPRYDLGDHWSLFARGDYEKTDYDNESSLGLDYYRTRGRLGVIYTGDLLESVELTYGMARRRVADSARLSYDEWWLQAEAAYWDFGSTNWSMLVAYRDRGYEEDGAARDHGRFSVELSPRWQVFEKLRLEALGTWEFWDYARDTGAYFDFSAGVVEPTLRCRLNDRWELAIDSRIRWEQAAATAFAEDEFAEYGAGPVLDWRPRELIWVQLGGLWGYRNYNPASSVYDDYDFAEYDVRLEGAFGNRLNFSFNGSFEQERHDDPTRDAEYFYLSFAVRAPFHL